MDEDFWTRVAAVDWNWRDVPGALRQLAVADGVEENRTAYHRMIDAVGHNHSGRLYAVLVPALPFLIEIALTGQEAALEVLLDVMSWLDWSDSPLPDSPDPAAAVRCFDGLRERFAALGTPEAGELVELLTEVDPSRPCE